MMRLANSAVACGPKEYAALWRRSGNGEISPQVDVDICMSELEEACSVTPPLTVTLTAGADNRHLTSVTMVADASRGLIVVASAVTCAVLRYIPSAPKEKVAARLDEVWRTEHLRGLDLSRPSSHDDAPLLLLSPQQPEGGDSLFLVAMQTCAVVFLELGGAATEPRVLHTVDISVSPLGKDILCLWWRHASEPQPPLLLLSRNRVFQAMDVPDLESWKLESRSTPRHRPMDLFSVVYTSDTELVSFMDVCDRHDLCLTGGHGNYIYLWKIMSAVNIALLKRVTVGAGMVADGYGTMGLGWVPQGALASFFVINANSDEFRNASLQYVQLFRQPALLTALLCLRRCAPELYAVGSTAVSATGSTTRAPRGSSILMTICELAGLEPPGRCSCTACSPYSSVCVCFGDPPHPLQPPHPYSGATEARAWGSG